MNESDLLKRLEELKKKPISMFEVQREKGWIDKSDPLILEHSDYLKTRLWKKIRKRIFDRDLKICKRCGGKADLVHHISYDPEVMLGNNDELLVSLCSGCHEIVHFDSDGKPRLDEFQKLVLYDLSFNENLPKVDLRLKQRNVQNWSRLTAVQKLEYIKQVNEKKRSK